MCFDVFSNETICSVITLYNSEALAVMFTVCGWRVCDNLSFDIYCQNCAIHCCFTWGEKLVSMCNDQCWAIYIWPAVAKTTSVIFLDTMTVLNIKLCNWYHSWFLPICSTFIGLGLSSGSQWHQIYLCAALSLTLTLIQGHSGIKLKVDILSHNPVKFKMIVEILGLRSYTVCHFFKLIF